MAAQKPIIKTDNAHFLKGHASGLYCDGCNKTVAYLCYVTYQYFHFSFICACGCHGSVENRYDDTDVKDLPAGSLMQNESNKRYCCENDRSVLFSPVPKNLRGYSAEVVCKECKTRYTIAERF